MSDLKVIDNVYKKYYKNEFGLPALKHCLDAQVVEEKKEFVALGIMHLVPELIMVMNKECSLRTKAKALKSLLNIAIINARAHSYNQLVASTPDNSYANSLEKHFNFKRMKDIPLVLNLE